MQKRTLLTIIFTAAYFSGFAADDFLTHSKPWETLSYDLKIVPLHQLSENDLQEIMQGKHPQLAVAFAAQTALPISFYLLGDLAHLIESYEKWGTVEIKQTFYARYVGEELVLSSNLTDWKPFLEFITGNVTASLKMEDGKPSICIGSETNRRS